MEFWVMVLLVLAVVTGLAGWAGVAAYQRQQLTGRQDRWRELERRFHRVTMDAERYERSPGDALAAPGWLDRSSPLVRGFAGTLKRAVRDQAELERSVTPASRKRGRGSAQADTASRLDPTEQDLESYELLVERVEDAYRDTDRAVRTAGWSAPGTLQIPHPQFLLDPRWGRPAFLPRLGSLDPQNAERSVKGFLDAAYPLRRETAVKALRERSGGPGAAYRAQKALDRLVTTRRYTTDRHGFLWPESTVLEHWGVYRVFDRKTELTLDDAPPVEIANVLWSLLRDGQKLTEEELLEEARTVLGASRGIGGIGGIGSGITQSLNDGIARGVQNLPKNVQRIIGDAVPDGTFIPSSRPRVTQRLHEGLHEGLVTGRLQRSADGRIQRLRTGWPSTYR